MSVRFLNNALGLLMAFVGLYLIINLGS